MSIKIMSRVWSHSQQRGGELLVMLALADFANDAGESWPSVPTLAQKARLTERQTQRVLKNLEESGELRRTKSNGGRNRRSHYFVTITENPDIITVTKLHRKNNSEICDTETLTPMSPALNRHRTVRKRRSEAASPNPAVNQFKEFWADRVSEALQNRISLRARQGRRRHQDHARHFRSTDSNERRQKNSLPLMMNGYRPRADLRSVSFAARSTSSIPPAPSLNEITKPERFQISYERSRLHTAAKSRS